MLTAYLACLFIALSPATASDWEIDTTQSRLAFFATQTGTKFSGTFNRFSVTVSFDPAAPEQGSITAVVDMASVNAGDKQRNTALPGKEWFDILAFPKARFVSSSIKALGAGQFVAEGLLTLHGISQPVSLPFLFSETGDGQAHVTASLSLNRSDYDIGSGVWASGKWVGFDVGLEITLVATRSATKQSGANNE